jgi:hypothetical protein
VDADASGFGVERPQALGEEQAVEGVASVALCGSSRAT